MRKHQITTETREKREEMAATAVGKGVILQSVLASARGSSCVMMLGGGLISLDKSLMASGRSLLLLSMGSVSRHLALESSTTTTITQTRGTKHYPRTPSPKERLTEVRRVIPFMEVPTITPDVKWRIEDIPDAVSVSTDGSSGSSPPVSEKDFPPDFKFATIPNKIFAPRKR